MNLHQIVAPLISAVNPSVSGTYQASNGYATDANYKQQPAYAAPVTMPMQVQALSAKDIEHLDALNIQGVVRKVFLNGNVQGVNRVTAKGGDLLNFNGRKWLVTIVFETWDASGWCSVGVTEQTA